MLNFISNLCTYGHNLGANLHRVQIVHMNTALSKVGEIAEHALTCRICLRKVNKLDSKIFGGVAFT